jgi:hypothetical protein
MYPISMYLINGMNKEWEWEFPQHNHSLSLVMHHNIAPQMHIIGAEVFPYYSTTATRYIGRTLIYYRKETAWIRE